MKKIGILGGISPASTLHYYETIHALFYEKHGHYYYPEVVVESLNFQYFTDLENENRLDEYSRYILQGLGNLAAAGADFAVMAANSPHSVLAAIRPDLPLPVLSIVDTVGRAAEAKSMRRLLLTGIAYTMRGTFYRDGLARYGIEVVSPSVAEQQVIDTIIFSELVIHQVNPASRRQILDIIEGYRVDGVILGCTELPQLVTPQDTAVPLLNSLRLHCLAAVGEAER